ncbi:GNAT family N-acetyltransferase [Edaphobacter modestus]|uniref:Acetyltransferase (GNAT) family protein n=1 Tax=Edaphobacter modestus TaxID=388466 RepID=A0A4Q7YT81_9BACT|nr:GNAT family N-acetyltransferase [Edaphobacter modestus]RZU40957.1 acetyltransferase (GNAT) family protein [Edaphobacter modestus]
MVSIRLAESREQIARCFPVMHQLRPRLVADDFVERIEQQQREGYRLAFLEQDGAVASVAGFRVMSVLWSGRTLYVDDLVTDEAMRSQGFGEQMISWLAALAREEGCETFSLDSGTHRQQAHAFYFRQGLRITDFHFQMQL